MISKFIMQRRKSLLKSR